jgi:hypothetical protein
LDVYGAIISKLKSELRRASLHEGDTYEEEQLKPAVMSFLNSLEGFASEVCRPFNQLGLLCALQHNVPAYLLKPREGFEGDMQMLFNKAAALAFHFCSATRDARIKLDHASYHRIAETGDTSWLW